MDKPESSQTSYGASDRTKNLKPVLVKATRFERVQGKGKEVLNSKEMKRQKRSVEKGGEPRGKGRQKSRRHFGQKPPRWSLSRVGREKGREGKKRKGKKGEK